MAQFRSDNGLKGLRRVSRTPTGYKGTIALSDYDVAAEDSSFLPLYLSINRGVGEDGNPYIELDTNPFQEKQHGSISRSMVDALRQAGLTAASKPSMHGYQHFCIHVDINRLGPVFEALVEARLDNGLSLIPKLYKDFVLEQQQVRFGLEQSLMHSFGEDAMTHAQKGQKRPRNEHDRIQRLVHYFRHGVPEIRARNTKPTTGQLGQMA